MALILEATTARCEIFPSFVKYAIISPGRAFSTGIFLVGLAVPEPKIVSLTRLANPPHPLDMLGEVPAEYPAVVYCAAIVLAALLGIPVLCVCAQGVPAGYFTNSS